MAAALMQQLSTHVNVDYIEQALEKAYKCKITIHDCDIKLVTLNGENYCSDIYKVTVKFEKVITDDDDDNRKNSAIEIEKRSLIIKDMIKEIGEFGSNEHMMYVEVLPTMEKFLSIAMDHEVKLKAECLLSERDEDKEIYILDDLNALGYHMADRCVGLDEQHAMVLMAKIAQFHAASMLFIEEFPTVVGEIPSAHFANGAADPLAKAIAIGGMEYASDIIEQLPDFVELAQKMRANIKHFDDRVKKIVNPRRTNFNVINHGDLWVNNFLFNYHENDLDRINPKDVIFVDFQNGFLGSPGYDLNYVLYTSVELNVLKSKRYELLHHYYDVLKTTLIRCGSTRLPTWSTLMQEIRNCAFIGYYAAVCELPICSMNRETAKGFTAFTFTDRKAMADKNRLLYGNERVLDTLKYTLDYFNEMGVLD